MNRIVIFALALLYCTMPAYGMFAVLDQSRPPVAPLVPYAPTLAILIGILALTVVVGIGVARRLQPLGPLFWPVAANFAVTLLGGALGFEPITGVVFSLALLSYAISHYGLERFYGEAGAPQTIYRWLFGSSIAAFALALVLAALKWPVVLAVVNNGRAVGTFLNPNELAAAALVIAGTAAGVAGATRERTMRALAVAALVLSVVTLAFTFSRSGLIAGGIGAAFFLARLASRRIVIGGAVVAAVALALELGVGARHHNPQDTFARTAAWATGAATFLRFPLTGMGPLAYHRTYDVFRPPDGPPVTTPVGYDPHNMLLSILDETGILGVAALVYGGVAFVQLYRRIDARAPQPNRILAYGITCGIGAVTLHTLLNSVSITFMIWFLFSALAIAALRFGLAERVA